MANALLDNAPPPSLAKLTSEERSKMEELGVNALEREWRAIVMHRFDSLENHVDSLYQQMRSEHVERSTYTVAHAALDARVTRVENGPARWVPWLALGVSSILGCLGLMIAGVAAVGTIVGVLFAVIHG